MATAHTPIETASQLRSEMRERTGQAIEAMLKRLGPSLARLDAESLAAILTCELVRVVEHVEHEHLSRLAELATVGEA